MQLEVAGVSCSIRSRSVLKDTQVVLGQGVTCLLGPNGAGKTTLLRILATTRKPDTGDVWIVKQHGKTSLQRMRLGYVPQTFSYYPHFTTRQFVAYVASLKRVRRSELDGAVDRALRATGLMERAEDQLRTLSGGMLRRAAIAQAVVNDPELLILDEPTAGLDPSQRREFLNLVTSISGERIVILSTHLVEDITAVADRILILVRGDIRFDGTPHELSGQDPGMALSTDHIAEGYEMCLAKYENDSG